ncbi:hypothetical protein M758_8G084400 [Ceratodon purpureus]|nr:hypothetical protein M758_8G084400 [Ceratodon purpureus]
MGNCVGRADDYVLPHNRHKWIAKCGQQVARGLLDCENSNLMAFNRKYAATDAALNCHKSLYGRCFDPCFPLPSEMKLIDPKIVRELAAERKSAKGAAVAPDIDPESPIAGKGREAKQSGVKPVRAAREKPTACKHETPGSTPADLNVYVVTWNMNSKVPTSNFADLFDVSGDSYDFFVVGFQEAPNFDAKSSISEVLGNKYCLVESSVLLSLQLFIFVKRSLKPSISGVKVDKVWEARLSGVMGTQKGAAAVRLVFADKSLLFITSHLAAHESNVKARNSQCAHICQSVFSRSTSAYSCFQPSMKVDDMNSRDPGVSSNMVEESDVVVWLGDLNYRIELPRSLVLNSIKQGRLQELHAKDQLSTALRKNQAFKGFQEGPLLFPPTFKYDVGTDNYDTSVKERVPSWTDRILYKTKRVKAELRSYDVISSVKSSDHRPVKAHITLKNLL